MQSIKIKIIALGIVPRKEINNMGMLKGHIQDWLELHGYELGYDWDNLPCISMMDGDCPPAKQYHNQTN